MPLFSWTDRPLGPRYWGGGGAAPGKAQGQAGAATRSSRRAFSFPLALGSAPVRPSPGESSCVGSAGRGRGGAGPTWAVLPASARPNEPTAVHLWQQAPGAPRHLPVGSPRAVSPRAPHVKDGVDVFFPVPAPTCWCGPCPVCAVGRRHVNVWGAEGSTRGHLTRELRPSGWRGDPRRDISPQSREMEKKVLNSTVGFTACARTQLSCVDARTYMTF